MFARVFAPSKNSDNPKPGVPVLSPPCNLPMAKMRCVRSGGTQRQIPQQCSVSPTSKTPKIVVEVPTAKQLNPGTSLVKLQIRAIYPKVFQLCYDLESTEWQMGTISDIQTTWRLFTT